MNFAWVIEFLGLGTVQPRIYGAVVVIYNSIVPVFISKSISWLFKLVLYVTKRSVEHALCFFSRGGHPAGAMEVFETMLEAGVKADHVSYNILIDACGRAGLAAGMHLNLKDSD